mgnify:CR=1 FL=1
MVTFFTSKPKVDVLDDDHIVIRTDSTIITFVDRRVADPDRPLVGTRSGASRPTGVAAVVRSASSGASRPRHRRAVVIIVVEPPRRIVARRSRELLQLSESRQQNRLESARLVS